MPPLSQLAVQATTDHINLLRLYLHRKVSLWLFLVQILWNWVSSLHTPWRSLHNKKQSPTFFFLILFFLSGAGVALSKLKCWSQVSGINTNVKWLQTSGWRDISMIARLASDSESLVKSHLSCSAPEWPWTSSELQVPGNYKVTDFSWLLLSVLSSLWPVCFFSTESTAYYL